MQNELNSKLFLSTFSCLFYPLTLFLITFKARASLTPYTKLYKEHTIYKLEVLQYLQEAVEYKCTSRIYSVKLTRHSRTVLHRALNKMKRNSSLKSNVATRALAVVEIPNLFFKTFGLKLSCT